MTTGQFYRRISVLPFAVFWRPFKGKSERAYHCLVWTAPIIIAVPFGIAGGAISGRGSFWDGSAVGALAAVCVGYLYVVLIENAFVASRAFGWVGASAPPAPRVTEREAPP